MKNEILTAKQLAQRLQIKTETVRLWARKGWIPSLRPSAKVLRFDLDSVLAAINSSRKESTNKN